MAASDTALVALMRAIAGGDVKTAVRRLAATPMLARAAIVGGATRADAKPHFLEAIQHYMYAGDTALHVAAAVYRGAIIDALLAAGADVGARNRRGAEPLHYAADGNPSAASWNPQAQAATIVRLVAAGADPNAIDKSGVAPLHRAVRGRCAAAVQALLAADADASRPNARGSTPMQLATSQTGRGGSGAPAAKAEQAEIVRILARVAGRKR